MATSDQYKQAAQAVAAGCATRVQQQLNATMAGAGTRVSSHEVRTAQDALRGVAPR